MIVTSGLLMERYQQGDTAAFDEIYARHRGSVESLIVNIFSKYAPRLRSHTADLVQEVFASIHEHRERYIKATHFAAWLYTTAKRLTQNHIKHEKRMRRDYRRTFRLGSDPMFLDPANVPRALIEEGLCTLPETHQQIMRLVYFDGLTSREVAEKIGKPISTVDWWRRESLTRMRKVLKEYA